MRDNIGKLEPTLQKRGMILVVVCKPALSRKPETAVIPPPLTKGYNWTILTALAGVFKYAIIYISVLEPFYRQDTR